MSPISNPFFAYLMEATPEKLALAAACFPRLNWRPAPRVQRSAVMGVIGKLTGSAKQWLSHLSTQDLLVSWQEKDLTDLKSKTPARTFVLEVAPLGGRQAFSFAASCLRLRPFNGSDIAELEPSGFPSLSLASPGERRSGILAVGSVDVFEAARKRFPSEGMRAIVYPDLNQDQELDEQGIVITTIAQLPQEIGTAAEIVTDVPEIALAALSLRAPVIAVGAAEAVVGWFGHLGPEERFDVGCYYGFADAETGSPRDAHDILQDWRIRVGCKCRAYLASDNVALEYARSCFPSFDWYTFTTESVLTPQDYLVVDEGADPPIHTERIAVIGLGPLVEEGEIGDAPLSLRLASLHGGSIHELAEQVGLRMCPTISDEVVNRSGILVHGTFADVQAARKQFPAEQIWAIFSKPVCFADLLTLSDLDIEVLSRCDFPSLLDHISIIITDISTAFALAARCRGVEIRASITSEQDQPGITVDPEETYYGFADRRTLAPLNLNDALSTWLLALATENPKQQAIIPRFADLRHLVIGQPKRAALPFVQHLGANAWQKPSNVSIADLEAAAAKLSTCEISVYVRDPEALAWLQMPGLSHWIVDRAPIDYPLMLTTSTAFIPAFHRLRVRTTAQGIAYALWEEVEAWSAVTRKSYHSLGRRLQPQLKRLQSARRLARFNKVEMGRSFGPLGSKRVLVLGRETESPTFVNTNANGLRDIQVLIHTLAERPDANILYMPQKVVLGDKAEMKEIQALGKRVRVIDQAYSLSEFAHVVDEVRTIDSPLGVMALASGLPVIVYGEPFYAGLGVTHDLTITGDVRPPCLSEPLNLNTFLGWHFSDNHLFADTLDGAPISVDTFLDMWTPYLGELTDALADRLVIQAMSARERPDDMRQYIRALVAHAKGDHMARLIALAGQPTEISSHFELAADILLEVARRGNWREAVDRVRLLWDHHNKTSAKKLMDLLISIRRTLTSPADTHVFSTYVLGTFRNLPSTSFQELGDAFASQRFFNAALSFYMSCQPSSEVSVARARCFIAMGDEAAARKVIATLESLKVAATVIEDFELELAQRKGHLGRAIEIIEHRVAKKPSDIDLQMLLANLYRDAGRLDDAVEILQRLLRSTQQGNNALRALAAIHLARMNTPMARGLLESQLIRMPTDTAASRLLADVEAFENNLPAAADQLLFTLRLSPLHIAVHTQLTELEAEMGVVEEDGFGPWTRAFDAFLSDIDQPTAETLMAHGRSRLQVHDFKRLKSNCATIIQLFQQDSSAHSWYAHALSWEPGEKDPETISEIRAHYDVALARGKEDNAWTLLDAIRSAAQIGDIAMVRRLVRENQFALIVGDPEKLVVPRYSAALALGDFAGAYDAMRLFNRTRVLRRHARPFRLALSLDEIKWEKDILLLSEGGVGDELRYSQIYPELASRFRRLTISVDQRLLGLFKRSYPMVERFVPLPRYDRKRLNRDLLDEISDLPERDLAPFMNNEVWRTACESQVVAPVVCLLGDLRKKETDFLQSHNVRLKPCPDLVAAWRKRLAPYADKLVVGVTWTSMMRQYQRIGNYLSHEEMEPLFRNPGAVFVNCQYESIDDELKWVREVLGVEIIDFPDLDKRDDFEGLAALIANFDLFIGTGTTTTEFAALLGCKTIYASPANMNAYRNPDYTERDLYFDNISFIRPIPTTERKMMIARIATLLDQAVAAKMTETHEPPAAATVHLR